MNSLFAIIAICVLVVGTALALGNLDFLKRDNPFGAAGQRGQLPGLSQEGATAMANWPFDDPPNVAAITVRQIVEGGAPILLVARDAHAGWQFLTGEECNMADALVVSLRSILERDPTIAELTDLKPGWQATRERVGAAWKREAAPREE
jgi:hypothetical protein